MTFEFGLRDAEQMLRRNRCCSPAALSALATLRASGAHSLRLDLPVGYDSRESTHAILVHLASRTTRLVWTPHRSFERGVHLPRKGRMTLAEIVFSAAAACVCAFLIGQFAHHLFDIVNQQLVAVLH